MLINFFKKQLEVITGTISDNYTDGVNISKDLILRYLPPNPVIIDCGAHIGVDSIELASIPGSKVYAFEPVSYLFKKLLDNTKSYANIFCFNLALSNIDGESLFYVSGGGSDGSSSLLKPKEHLSDHPTVTFETVEKVKCMKLDTWARENKIAKVDLLWLDMQGFEFYMLNASEEILQHVSVIHTEVSVHDTYEGVLTYTKFREYLEYKGFTVAAEAIPRGYDMGNVLFVRNLK